MAVFDKELLKKIRLETNASYADCKEAITSTNSYEDAIKWLRSRGVAKAVKKMDAEATEGVITLKIAEGKAVMMEVNTQTDFVAKNETFTKFTNDLTELVFESNATSVNDVNDLPFDNSIKVSEKIVELIATTGEKISIRRIRSISTSDLLVGYLHANKRIGVIVQAKSGDLAGLKKIAMHVAAMSPLFVDQSKIDASWRDKEIEIIKAQIQSEDKAKEFVEKIIEGRYQKVLQECVLMEQKFFLDSSLKVADFLKTNNIVLVDIFRFELGENA